MIYKENTIYKNGLTLEDFENASTWIDITDELGTKETGFEFSRVSIVYNKLIGMIRIRGYSSKNVTMNGVISVFTFNTDIPGFDSNGAFVAEATAFAFEGGAAQFRAQPWGPISNINGFITVQLTNGSKSFTYDCFSSIKNELKEQFNNYLGM